MGTTVRFAVGLAAVSTRGRIGKWTNGGGPTQTSTGMGLLNNGNMRACFFGKYHVARVVLVKWRTLALEDRTAGRECCKVVGRVAVIFEKLSDCITVCSTLTR
jgi:hypothetical protein